MQTTEVV